MSHLATQEKIIFLHQNYLLHLCTCYIFGSWGGKKPRLPGKLYVLFGCQSKGLTKAGALITTGNFLPSLLMASRTALPLSHSLFCCNRQWNDKTPKMWCFQSVHRGSSVWIPLAQVYTVCVTQSASLLSCSTTFSSVRSARLQLSRTQRGGY